MNLNKPKFWDYKKPNLLAFILLPLAFLVRIISFLKIKSKKENLNIKTICIGNIYVGGTGKTSLCIQLNEILKKRNIKTCFIKKFYNNQADEQILLSNRGKLFLDKKRINAVKKAVSENYEVAIFDDGLQDKTINYDKTFVCFNTINWIGNGMTIPAGPLRENISTIKKYNHIFINGNMENLEVLKQKILNINPKIVIHVGRYKIQNLNEFKLNENYLVFSGIGNHETFVSMLKEYGIKVIKDFEFPDHYQYSVDDIENILKKANILNCNIITTEKDYIRINFYNKNKIKFIKSELKIIDEEKLIKSIL